MADIRPYSKQSTKRLMPASVDVNNLPSYVRVNLSLGGGFHQYMSAIRQYFCLFVLIDLAIICITYVQYLKHADDFSLVDLIACQMKCYSISTSLIDILLLSIVRFAVLESAYGMAKSNSWAAVGLTTSLTSVFFLVKPFYYEWSNDCQPIWPLTMMLISILLTWSESFLVHYWVIAMESLANKYKNALPEINTKEVPKMSVFRAFFQITTGLVASILGTSDFFAISLN